MDITIEELAKLNAEEYILYDMRSDLDRSYGYIKNSLPLPEENKLLYDIEKQKEKKIIVYCARGENSIEIAEKLCDMGYNAYNLKGGYAEWLREELKKSVSEDFRAQVEKSIQTKFRHDTLGKFIKAIKRYNLIEQGDKIAVCISGGKDSMLMAKLFQELQKYTEIDFSNEFIVMDPGYNEQNRKLIEENAKNLGIPVKIFESDIFENVYNIEKSPCYVCARMRRGYLYQFAKQCGCNKIALGHHYDDVIETILMAMLYGAQIQTMMPKLHATNFKGMQLIRPMYLIREKDIKEWRDYNGLHFLQCACKFTDTCTTCRDDGVANSKRQEIKLLIEQLKETNPDIEQHIFKSVENVNLEKIIAYKAGDKITSFLDTYEKDKGKE